MAQVVTNKSLVDRNARMGKILTTTSLIVILAPLALTFPALFSGQSELPGNSLLLMYGALIVGLILSNIGGYFMNRWGFKYYEQLEKALKGTDKKYRLYNYSLPVPNALLTPYGITVLLLKNLDGHIYVNQNGWRMNFDLLRLVRWFSAEQLGNPTKDLETQTEKLVAFIHDRLGEDFNPPMDGLIVFTNPKAVIEVSNIELPIVFLPESPNALKDALKKPKGTPLISQQDYNALYELFEEEAEARRIEAERGLVIAGRKLF
jgi:hypothetical protein